MIIAKENDELGGAPADYIEAHDKLSRALFALNLELDGSIVADLNTKVFAAIEAARNWGIAIGIKGEDDATVCTLQQHHLDVISEAIELLYQMRPARREDVGELAYALQIPEPDGDW